MRRELRRLAQLAAIDLAYARAEVAYAEDFGDAQERMAFHLDEASRRLAALAKAFDNQGDDGAAGGAKASRRNPAT